MPSLSAIATLKGHTYSRGGKMDNLHIILLALLALSEALALIPGLKSNSVFQLVVNIVKMLAGGGPAQLK